MKLNTDGPWVDVVFIQDWDIEWQGDSDDVPEWGDWEAMAQYLSQWDYGTETDDAQTQEWGAGYYDDVHHFTIGGLEYVLTTGPLKMNGYAGLVRRPLGYVHVPAVTDIY